MSENKLLWIINAGRIAYGPAFDLQREIVAASKAGAIPDVLLFCEHPHVITLGRNGQYGNLLASANVLKQMNVEFHETDRGGDITYHGPGQIVGYPILDLAQHKRDVRWYVERLEEVMIRTAADYGLAARRILCRHGIWIDAPQGEEKLAALGVHLSRWVTSHGFAFNVSTDLRYFDLIIPCGIKDKRATSLERALGRSVSLDEARARLAAHFAEIFGVEPQAVSLDELQNAIGAVKRT
ncbi:MAG TPA: lipoyl(octanoyl) transferase LipB [Candidatus Acidoferrales bacterium]|nr:lipoyl(octanoyl) transferase LipB [Candidatus Acidoferrales bacterium]